MKSLLNIGFIFFLIASMTGCLSDADTELGYNILDDPSVEHISIDYVEFIPVSTTFRDLKIYLETVLDQMPPNQRSKVAGFMVYRNGSPNVSWDLPRLWFIDTNEDIGVTVCYEFAFVTNDGTMSKMSSEYCVTVE